MTYEGGENPPRPKINAPETQTLNRLGGVFEAEAVEGFELREVQIGSGTLTEVDSSCSRSVAPN